MIKVAILLSLLVTGGYAQRPDSCAECLGEWQRYYDIVHLFPEEVFALIKIVSFNLY
jgi:hypothetical protein